MLLGLSCSGALKKQQLRPPWPLPCNEQVLGPWGLGTESLAAGVCCLDWQVATLHPNGLSVPKQFLLCGLPLPFWGVVFVLASNCLQRLPGGSSEQQYSELKQIEKSRRHLRLAPRTKSSRKI